MHQMMTSADVPFNIIYIYVVGEAVPVTVEMSKVRLQLQHHKVNIYKIILERVSAFNFKLFKLKIKFFYEMENANVLRSHFRKHPNKCTSAETSSAR